MNFRRFLVSLGVFVVWMFFANVIFNASFDKSPSKSVVAPKKTPVKATTVNKVAPPSKKNEKSKPKIKKYICKESTKSNSFVCQPSLLDKIYKQMDRYPSLGLHCDIIISKSLTEDKGISKFKEMRNKLLDSINPARIDIVIKKDTVSPNRLEVYFEKMNSQQQINAQQYLNKYLIYAKFNPNTFIFNADKSLQRYVSNLKKYLHKNSKKKIKIIGHTDAVGPMDANMWIGEQRAKSILKYLVYNGIDSTRISVLSKGPSDPIAPNDTLEGRKKNKRIEIIIN